MSEVKKFLKMTKFASLMFTNDDGHRSYASVQGVKKYPHANYPKMTLVERKKALKMTWKEFVSIQIRAFKI